LRAEADARGADLATLAFAWVLARVDGAVCGPNRAEQLDPILAARELRLSADDVDRIGGFFA
jgi:aryl-alcohol dehydrogenase-like predicted oxidoreductase